ncbi:MAG: hypothetical protein RIQ89_687 [Bacteroidota bacterium]
MYNTPFHTLDISNKNFLVTGGAGFIGSNIVEYLIKHGAAKVRVLDNYLTGFKDNLEPYQNNPAFELLEGDITNAKDCIRACEGIHYISHQAALGSVPRSLKDPVATHAHNASGFINILLAARDAGVKQIVYASSSSVYGDSPTLPKREAEIGNPLSPYAVSKYTNELYAHVFASSYKMRIIGLRYFNVFGPRQSPTGAYAAVIPLFMQAVFNNKSPMIDGDGEQTRDFTFVENAVQANILAMLTNNDEAVNQVYNVAVGERSSINQLYNNITKIENSELKPIHRESRAGDIRNSLADISKIKKLLNYKPNVMLNEGLAITLDWFKNSTYNK